MTASQIAEQAARRTHERVLQGEPADEAIFVEEYGRAAHEARGTARQAIAA